MHPSLLSEKATLEAMHSSGQGLTQKEAQRRLETQGPNELKEDKKTSPLFIFLAQFKDVLIILLLIAALLSLFVGHLLEAGAMIAIVILSAGLGFLQEYKAERAIAALRQIAAPHARVIRDNHEQQISARDLVIGDIIVLSEGDIVPADARLLEVNRLEVNEASLTGESISAQKNTTQLKSSVPIADQDNMVFMGTAVSYGKAKAVVVTTGMLTELGKIAESLQETKSSQTPLQRKFSRLARQIGIIVLILVGIIIFASWFKGEADLIMLFIFALSLAVAAVPSSLPAIVTIGLSLGAKTLAQKNMIVKSLPATESLGSATIICSDKTGTLTKNEMTITRIFSDDQIVEVSGTGYEPQGEFTCKGKKAIPPQKLLEIGMLCNDAIYQKGEGKWEMLGDPTEGSILVLAHKAGLEREALLKNQPVIDEFPFDSDRKMMSVLVHNKKTNKKEAYVKGAPDMLLKQCTHILKKGKVVKLLAKDKERILDQNKLFAQDALRVLGFAYKEIKGKADSAKAVEKELIFVGLVGMIDPPREGVRQAILDCKTAGIEVMIITGDHALTTQAIAKQLGMFSPGDVVLTGEEVEELSDKELTKMISKVRIIARALPIQKKRIVELLQKQGHVVAMTGDGVNDAPALKLADIGIAMGQKGTEVAKEVSKAILVDDHFATIVNAIAEGRHIYDKILKSTRYLLSCNMGEIVVVFLAILINAPLPLLPLQILIMNLLTDGLPALALSTEPQDKMVMQRPPRNPGEQPLNQRTASMIFFFGMIMGLVTLFTFLISPEYKAQTIAFTTLVVLEMFAVIGSRSLSPFRQLNPFTNKWLVIAISSSLIIQVALLYIPFFQVVFGTVALSLFDWALILGCSAAAFMVMELSKFFFFGSKDF